ncbi:MAG: hypothetical protein IH622_22820 [Ochrobactrum anthropi]|uniref:Uncharacterized protein n=1 Tax=Brucella anthropi TaxID=529 RepID=A0A8I0N9Q3_BRUAN|nr:hypothetical protein [Brucella anthropi]MBE0563630.1 hypothetical protein [Brucella anthropi]
MAIEDLLKKAVAAFNALSPEQQAEMMEEQRQSWVRGNVGLSRDERGMTSPVMPRPAPADLKARDRKRYKLIRKSLQNKGLLPAATDTGLDYYTAADVMWSLEGIDPVPSKNGQWVKRSQAEELLVAERANCRKVIEDYHTLATNASKRADDLEAKLAAAEKSSRAKLAAVKQMVIDHLKNVEDCFDRNCYETARIKIRELIRWKVKP